MKNTHEDMKYDSTTSYSTAPTPWEESGDDCEEEISEVYIYSLTTTVSVVVFALVFLNFKLARHLNTKALVVYMSVQGTFCLLSFVLFIYYAATLECDQYKLGVTFMVLSVVPGCMLTLYLIFILFAVIIPNLLYYCDVVLDRCMLSVHRNRESQTDSNATYTHHQDEEGLSIDSQFAQHKLPAYEEVMENDPPPPKFSEVFTTSS